MSIRRRKKQERIRRWPRLHVLEIRICRVHLLRQIPTVRGVRRDDPPHCKASCFPYPNMTAVQACLVSASLIRPQVLFWRGRRHGLLPHTVSPIFIAPALTVSTRPLPSGRTESRTDDGGRCFTNPAADGKMGLDHWSHFRKRSICLMKKWCASESALGREVRKG